MNKSNCSNNSMRNSCDNQYYDLFIVLVLFILLAIIVSAVFTY